MTDSGIARLTGVFNQVISANLPSFAKRDPRVLANTQRRLQSGLLKLGDSSRLHVSSGVGKRRVAGFCIGRRRERCLAYAGGVVYLDRADPAHYGIWSGTALIHRPDLLPSRLVPHGPMCVQHDGRKRAWSVSRGTGPDVFRGAAVLVRGLRKATAQARRRQWLPGRVLQRVARIAVVNPGWPKGAWQFKHGLRQGRILETAPGTFSFDLGCRAVMVITDTLRSRRWFHARVF